MGDRWLAKTLRTARLALACAGALAACGPSAAPGDAATAGDAAGDAAMVPGARCVAEPGEQCTACYQNIGRCCYDDPTISGNLDRLVAACGEAAACVACCNECAQMSCDQLRDGGSCPNL